jgi:hypothetical protein
MVKETAFHKHFEKHPFGFVWGAHLSFGVNILKGSEKVINLFD